MERQLPALSWTRLAVAGAVALLAAYALPTLVIVGKGLVVGFHLRDAPPAEQVQAFAEGSLPWGVPAAVLLSVGFVAWRIALRAQIAPRLHAIALGVLVAIAGGLLDFSSGT